jgi:hypothetical protein
MCYYTASKLNHQCVLPDIPKLRLQIMFTGAFVAEISTTLWRLPHSRVFAVGLAASLTLLSFPRSFKKQPSSCQANSEMKLGTHVTSRDRSRASANRNVHIISRIITNNPRFDRPAFPKTRNLPVNISALTIRGLTTFELGRGSNRMLFHVANRLLTLRLTEVQISCCIDPIFAA